MFLCVTEGCLGRVRNDSRNEKKHIDGIGGCSYLRYGGLPVVNVKRSTYPPGTWLDRPFDWQLNLLSDGQYRTLLVPAPPTPPDTDAAAALYGAAVVLDDSSAIQQQVTTRWACSFFS